MTLNKNQSRIPHPNVPSHYADVPPYPIFLSCRIILHSAAPAIPRRTPCVASRSCLLELSPPQSPCVPICLNLLCYYDNLANVARIPSLMTVVSLHPRVVLPSTRKRMLAPDSTLTVVLPEMDLNKSMLQTRRNQLNEELNTGYSSSCNYIKYLIPVYTLLGCCYNDIWDSLAILFPNESCNSIHFPLFSSAS